MFEATDNAELARQERALKAGKAEPTTAPDLTPTQVAIAAMRAQRGVSGYPATGNEWLLLDALDEAETEAAQLRQQNAALLGEASALQADLSVATKQLKRLDKELIRLRDENREYEKCFGPDGRAA